MSLFSINLRHLKFPALFSHETFLEPIDRVDLTFASVALSHESPEQLRAVVTVGRLVEVLLDEAVPVLVAQVVVFHGADGRH